MAQKILENIYQNQSEPHEIATTEEMQNLHAQVEKLVTHNQPALKETGTLKDAEKIVTWIECYEQGFVKAEKKILNEGVEMLDSIKDRLHLAHEEQQRMEEESPSVASDETARGREAERFGKAAGNANDAVETITNITEIAGTQS